MASRIPRTCADIDLRLPCSASAAKGKKGYSKDEVLQMLHLCGLPGTKRETMDTLCHRLADHLEGTHGKRGGFKAHAPVPLGPNAKPHRPAAKKTKKPEWGDLSEGFDFTRPCSSASRSPDAYRADEVVDMAHRYGVASQGRSMDAICRDLKEVALHLGKPVESLSADQLACRDVPGDACISFVVDGKRRHYSVKSLHDYITRRANTKRPLFFPGTVQEITKSQIARVRKELADLAEDATGPAVHYENTAGNLDFLSRFQHFLHQGRQNMARSMYDAASEDQKDLLESLYNFVE